MKKVLLFCAILAALWSYAAGIKVDISGFSQEIPVKAVAASGYLKGNNPAWAKEKKDFYLCFEQGVKGAKWQKYRLKFTPDKSGELAVLLRSVSSGKSKADWFIYRNIQLSGAEWKNQWHRVNSNGGISREGEIASHYASRTRNISVTAGKPVEVAFEARFDATTPSLAHPTAPQVTEAEKKGGNGKVSSAPLVIKRDLSQKAKIRIELDSRQLAGSKIVNTSASKGLVIRPCPAMGEEGKFYFEVVGTEPLTDQWQEFEFSLTLSSANHLFIILRAEDEGSPERWVAYDDIRVTGADGYSTDFESWNGKKFSGWESNATNAMLNRTDAANGKRYAVASYKHALRGHSRPFAGEVVTVKFKAKNGGAADVSAPGAVKFDQPRSYYQVYNRHAKYLPLTDKGLKGSEIGFTKSKSVKLYPEFPAPVGAKSQLAKKSAPVELLEESGIAHTANVRFGLPFPEKTVYNFSSIRVVNPDGKAVPAQISVTAYWPDKSIKMALIQFDAPLKANEKSLWHVEYGKGVDPVAAPSLLKAEKKGDKITVDTGVMTAEIDTKRFNLLSNIKVDGKNVGGFDKEGLVLVDENGKVFNTVFAPPVRVAAEEQGSLRLVYRFDGKLTDAKGAALADYVIRLGFRPDSAKVDLAISFFNTNLVNEFTDYTKLSLAFVPAAPVKKLVMEGRKGSSFFQMDDLKAEIDGKKFTAKNLRLSGSGASADGKISFSLRNAWQRYPKAFSAQDGKIVFSLLPEMPDKDFGADLPWYCRFPLCQGKYRMKWGQSFTEDLTIDFSGKTSPQELAVQSVIPVIDRDYLFETKVFEGVLPKSEHSFDRWDKSLVAGAYELEKSVIKQREYGFLNYGDNYGERGRNWNNNEYDTANGLFLLFLRTGNRDVARRAFLAARHQADVDIIHAYPNMLGYWGCNAQHGIGHTGISCQPVNPATWSCRLDNTFIGKNGHTWSEGMLDTWMYTGDAVVMDSALLLANHLADHTSPEFVHLGTHERSAGWSVRAMLAFYRATGEKRYFDAAKRVVDIALKEQKFDKGGAWAHKLPRDHSGGHHDAFGNTPYLMGILSEMMRQYYRIDPRPEVKKSLISVSGWLRRAHDKEAIGWSYGVSWDAKPYHSPNSSCNGIAVTGMICGGRLEGNPENFEIGKRVVYHAILKGIGGAAKSISMDLCFSAQTIEELYSFAKEYPQLKPFDGNFSDFICNLKINSQFKVRGPDIKEFEILLKAPETTLKIERCKAGTRPMGKKSYSIIVTDPAGKKILEKEASTLEKSGNYEVHLKGRTGDRFKVLIDDDMSGNWNVERNPQVAVFSRLLPNYSFTGGSIDCRYLTVPAGVDSFKIDFRSVHKGSISCFLIDDQGKLIGSAFAVNNAGHTLPWIKLDEMPRDGVLEAKFPAAKKPRNFRLILAAAGDIRLGVTGIPPCIGIDPELYR